jgi:hypothetical protein
MPSEKVAGALERLGVDVPADSFGHYGVPGMKWGQRKASDSGSADSVRKMAEKRGMVYDKKSNSYSSAGAKKPSPETMARVRLAAAGKGAAISKAQIKADTKVIKKIAKDDAKLQDKRLRGVSRIVQYGGDAKKANRASTREAVSNALRNATAVGLTVGVASVAATAGIAVPGALIGGVAVLAGLSAAGKMNQTVRDIRNVNAASRVFNPNSLLNRQNG